MLSLLPQILFLAPLGTTLLRIAAGIAFLIVAWIHYSRKAELGQEEFVAIGRGAWIPLFAALVEFLTGGMLILGAYTQAVALVGALLALKQFVWQRRYPQFFPLPRSTTALLFAICLALLVTGAGIFAFDLPL